MTLSFIHLILQVLCFVALKSVAHGAGEQCFGLDPQADIVSYLGATLDYSTADRICCHNHRWAEYKGYLASEEVDLFGRLDPKSETVFYDSVCGLPLFIAPRGRSFEAFKEESLHHGWPSFRPEEIISENVIIHDNGRMESKCLTHLGHNLPKDGIDRYCIDLVCIAGAPPSPNDERADVLMDENIITADQLLADILMDENVITADQLDQGSYVSSAEQYSGKTSNTKRNAVISVATIGSFVAVAAIFYCTKIRCGKTKEEKQLNDKQSTQSRNDGEATMQDEEESA